MKRQKGKELPKAILSRQSRRLERQEAANAAEFANKATKNSAIIDKKVEHITGLLREAGVKFVEKPPEIKFVSDTAYDAVTMSLRKLAYNPDGNLQDTSLPWCGNGITVTQARKVLSQLLIPPYAKDLKEGVLQSFTQPSTTGMIRPDGKPNKDLQQLLTVSGPIRWTEQIRRCYEKAMARLVDEFRTWNKGALRFNNWSLAKFTEAMKNSIKESSPGYPLNGFGWNDDIGGRTALEEVYLLGVDGRTKGHEEGYLFIQGARYTGDGGYTSDSTKLTGQQRLVGQAPAREKLDGHIISEAPKAFFKIPPGSGQRGIQAVTRHIKDVFQGKAKPYFRDREIVAVGSADISKWDTAQTDEFSRVGFFDFMQRVCDPNCEFTMGVLRNYQEAYFGRMLWTAMGFIQPDMLKSGASITTVLAFVHHTLLMYTFDYLVLERTGDYALADFGLQGDDQWAAYIQWNDVVKGCLEEVYSAFNCVVKGDLRIRYLHEEDPTIVFLNECIYLTDERPNVVFPKWNFFYAETMNDRIRGVNIDRMLLAEVRSRVAHPSPVELLFVSYLSKMDRFRQMPYYRFLLNWTRKRSSIGIRSWIGERVAPESETLELLKSLEDAENIHHPGDIVAACDRQEDTWLGAKEIGQLVASLWICAESCSSSKKEIRRLIRYGRGFGKPWKRAGKVVPPEIKGDKVKSYEQLRELVSEAFLVGYKEVAESLEKEREAIMSSPKSDSIIEALDRLEDTSDNDGEPIVMSTLVRAALAYNEANPYELVSMAYKSIAKLKDSMAWENLSDEKKAFIEETLANIYSWNGLATGNINSQTGESAYEVLEEIDIHEVV